MFGQLTEKLLSMTINEMIAKVEKLNRNYPSVVAKTLRINSGVVLDLQKSQLLSGKNSDMSNLSPDMNIDPYFKSQKHRDRYITNKKRMESKLPYLYSKKYNLFGSKNYTTPNLIVTGKYHTSLKIDVNREKISIFGTWSKSKSIERKYPNALGLSERSLIFLRSKFIIPDLVTYWNEGTM